MQLGQTALSRVKRRKSFRETSSVISAGDEGDVVVSPIDNNLQPIAEQVRYKFIIAAFSDNSLLLMLGERSERKRHCVSCGFCSADTRSDHRIAQRILAR